MQITIDQVGARGAICLEATIDYEILPAEWPEPGYPGAPERVEILGVTVARFMCDDTEICRADRPDWLAWADRIAAGLVDRSFISDRILH